MQYVLCFKNVCNNVHFVDGCKLERSFHLSRSVSLHLHFFSTFSWTVLLKWQQLFGNVDLHASALDLNVSSEINSQLRAPSYFLLLFYPQSREELSLAFCTATPLIGTRICKNGNLSKTCHKILKANHKLTNFFHSFKGNSNWNLRVNFYEDPWGQP